MGPMFSEREHVIDAKNRIDTIKMTHEHLSVDFHKMNANVCKEIWNYCVGTEFDAQRWQMLDAMNIEIIPEKKISQLERFH